MRNNYRSFFWPAVLILIGVFALLVNAGLVPVERLNRLVDLWPLILVVIGLEILVRRAFHGPAAELAALLVVLVAIVGAATFVALGPAVPTGTQTLDTSGKVGSLDHATVTVEVGAANITMQGGGIGDDLYRAHIEYSGNKPDVSLDSSSGDLRISQGSSSGFFFFQNRRFVLNLQLNPSVQWKVTVDSGSAADTFNLPNIRVASIDINTGASHEDITLGQPSGTIPVTINGGALTVNVHRPRGVAASAAVTGGAVNLNFDGRQSHAVGSATDKTRDDDGASDRYQIQVDGGASNVRVDTSAPVG